MNKEVPMASETLTNGYDITKGILKEFREEPSKRRSKYGIWNANK